MGVCDSQKGLIHAEIFVEPSQIDEGAHQIHITGSDVKHIVNVLRMKTGEELWISDGDKKEYHCTN